MNTYLGPWLPGCDQVLDRSHPRHLLSICRQLEVHGEQRVGLRWATARYSAKRNSGRRGPRPGSDSSPRRLAKAYRVQRGPRQAESRGRHRPTSTPWVSGGRPACFAKLKEMQTLSGDFELTMDEVRAIAGYAVRLRKREQIV